MLKFFKGTEVSCRMLHLWAGPIGCHIGWRWFKWDRCENWREDVS